MQKQPSSLVILSQNGLSIENSQNKKLKSSQLSQSRTKMTWAGQMAQSRTGQDKSPKAGRPAQGRTSGSSVCEILHNFYLNPWPRVGLILNQHIFLLSIVYIQLLLKNYHLN